MRQLADGGAKSGVTFTMKNYNSGDCSGSPWNVDANFDYLNFPIAPVAAGTPAWQTCIDVDNGGSRADNHCVMTTTPNQFRGRVYQSNDCSGAHTTFAVAADDSCVATADGSMRVHCRHAQVAASQTSSLSTGATIVFIVLPTALGVCLLCSLLCCVYYFCIRKRRQAPRTPPVLQLEGVVSAEAPAPQPMSQPPLMTTIQ